MPVATLQSAGPEADGPNGSIATTDLPANVATPEHGRRSATMSLATSIDAHVVLELDLPDVALVAQLVTDTAGGMATKPQHPG